MTLFEFRELIVQVAQVLRWCLEVGALGMLGLSLLMVSAFLHDLLTDRGYYH